tara:strand:+ start:141 stop:314 length:174 start_codon:yes stop_codon:yes gene_type:complete
LRVGESWLRVGESWVKVGKRWFLPSDLDTHLLFDPFLGGSVGAFLWSIKVIILISMI